MNVDAAADKLVALGGVGCDRWQVGRLEDLHDGLDLMGDEGVSVEEDNKGAEVERTWGDSARPG